MKIPVILLVFLCFSLSTCTTPTAEKADNTNLGSKLLSNYTSFRLEADLSGLSDSQKVIIRKLIMAAEIMDKLFWYEAYGSKEKATALTDDEKIEQYILINYGPWDRFSANQPFIPGVEAKPAGANFYPPSMTREEFEAADLPDKKSLYTFIRYDKDSTLMTVPYREMFAEEVASVAEILRECAELAENPGFKKYLELRADALLTDNYQPSDLAWMDMKTNQIDVVIGPIENYEDALFNYKAAHEAYVLIKDMKWSEKLARYAAFLPELQEGLPVPDKYKQEKPGANAELNAYDVVYYAGDCNAGSKTIAINLPNDEEVQLSKGSRRLQLKNAMKAKYEKILIPISEMLINEEQQKLITFDAFFANTMFHEVAHGLGIKNTINNLGTVRQALKENYSALEEGKADILGLYMITQLHEKGELEGALEEYYTTFMASIFRSVRFGASSAHGKANMIRFNYFMEMGAMSKDNSTGRYTIEFDLMKSAMNSLSEVILTLQGDGNYDGVSQLVGDMGSINESLQNDLDGLSKAGIPIDIVFEQGIDILGL